MTIASQIAAAPPEVGRTMDTAQAYVYAHCPSLAMDGESHKSEATRSEATALSDYAAFAS
jgi:hypothetical protein